MYPKVFTDYAATERKYGPVSALPTPVFFYGMKPGEEIAVEIEYGKALVVQLTALGDTREDGQVEVFFELNGQPRVIAVPNRNQHGLDPEADPAQPRKRPGDALHVVLVHCWPRRFRYLDTRHAHEPLCGAAP
jgi:pyruvate carboxylase